MLLLVAFLANKHCCCILLLAVLFPVATLSNINIRSPCHLHIGKSLKKSGKLGRRRLQSEEHRYVDDKVTATAVSTVHHHHRVHHYTTTLLLLPALLLLVLLDPSAPHYQAEARSRCQHEEFWLLYKDNP